MENSITHSTHYPQNLKTSFIKPDPTLKKKFAKKTQEVFKKGSFKINPGKLIKTV